MASKYGIEWYVASSEAKQNGIHGNKLIIMKNDVYLQVTSGKTFSLWKILQVMIERLQGICKTTSDYLKYRY